MGRNRAYQRWGGKDYRATRNAVATAVIETLESRALLSTYTVSNTNDSGSGSLRQAITDANSHAGADTIRFAIGSGAKTISPSKSLPGLGDGTTLDATTQPGYAGKPLITINGSGAGSADGIRVSGTGVTVRGLAVVRFKGSGFLVLGKGGNTIAGCYVGVEANGTTAGGNSAHGILLQSPNNTVGGTTAADRNVISANGQSGVFCYTSAAHHNTISGNYIGTNSTGTDKLGNARNGVQIDGAPSNMIGGPWAAARNVISGNARDGVLIVNAGANLNAVQGNRIGTNANGTGRLGNGWYGVEISRENNVVGGTAKRAGNVISANGYGGLVLYLSSASGNRIQHNYIGTDAAGAKDLGNIGRGLEFTNGAHDNRVGGSGSRERNIISGNDNGGVGIYSGSQANLLYGNYIGTDSSGSKSVGNTGAGVMVTDGAGSNFIGGNGLGNVISGNKQGICLSSGTGASTVQGNKIGTDSTGVKDLGNTGYGIYVGSSKNTIGGSKAGQGNLIAFNDGKDIQLGSTSGNIISGNSMRNNG